MYRGLLALDNFRALPMLEVMHSNHLRHTPLRTLPSAVRTACPRQPLVERRLLVCLKVSLLASLLAGLLACNQNNISHQQSLMQPSQLSLAPWLLLESAREEGTRLDISADTTGVLIYYGGTLPPATGSKPRMYTFKSSFSVPTEGITKPYALYTGLFEYPYRIYLNGVEIFRRGRYLDGHYNSSLRLANQVYLPPASLRTDRPNDLVIQAYPLFETWALDRIYIDSLDKVAAAVFWRNFLAVNLLQAACVLSFAIGLYFVLLNLVIKGDTRHYIYFAIFAFLFALTYVNVVIFHESMNEILLETLSKAGMVVLPTALLFFIQRFTGLLSNKKLLWRIILALSGGAAIIVFLQPDKETLLAAFSLALNLLIVPQLLFSIVLVLVYKLRDKGTYFWPLFISLMVLVATVVHDAYYFLAMTLPFAWLMTYGFFALVVGIFSTLVAEHAKVYRTTARQAHDLRIKQSEIEQLNQELILQKNSFYRFVPTEFLQLLGKKSAVDIQLGDNSLRPLSVLFSDIRRYTGMCEDMPPDENFEFLNSYLYVMEKAIYQNKGFIDKYIGDAIMALFAVNDTWSPGTCESAEPRTTEAADIALTAALEMEDALAAFNRHMQLQGQPFVSIGIGINTGTAVLGTVGSTTRLDTTVIGDSVNIASRIENLTKMYRVTTLVSEHTQKALVCSTKFNLRHIDTVVLSGRSKPLKLFELLNLSREDDKKRLDSSVLLERGLHLYGQKAFAEAEATFCHIEAFNPADTIAQLYRARCQSMLETAPATDWDGIFRPHK